MDDSETTKEFNDTNYWNAKVDDEDLLSKALHELEIEF